MNAYNFENLNDKEFEDLVNRLISKRDNCSVDRFKAGRDQGVDGRVFSPNSGDTIIQSKHCLKSSIPKLLNILRIRNYRKSRN